MGFLLPADMQLPGTVPMTLGNLYPLECIFIG